MKKDKIYILISIKITPLGGPIGTEYTYDNWIKYFHSLENAKKYAEEDNQKESKTKETIKWKKESKGEYGSGDLRFVMYNIKELEFED